MLSILQNFATKFTHNIKKIRFKSQNRIQKFFFKQNLNSISSNGKNFLSFSTHKGGIASHYFVLLIM